MICETRFFVKVSWWQIQGEMYIFVRHHGLNLRNVSAKSFPSQQLSTLVCSLQVPVVGSGNILSLSKSKQSWESKQADTTILSFSSTGDSLRSQNGKSVSVDEITWLLIFNFLREEDNSYLAVNMSVTNITNQTNLWNQRGHVGWGRNKMDLNTRERLLVVRQKRDNYAQKILFLIDVDEKKKKDMKWAFEKINMP